MAFGATFIDCVSDRVERGGHTTKPLNLGRAQAALRSKYQRPICFLVGLVGDFPNANVRMSDRHVSHRREVEIKQLARNPENAFASFSSCRYGLTSF